MKIGILIFSEKPQDAPAAQADRFIEAGKRLGFEVVNIYESRLKIVGEQKKQVAIFNDGDRLPPDDFAAVIARPNFTEEPGLHTCTINALMACGFRVVNGRALIAESKNKLSQHLRLAATGLPMPRWAIARRPEDATAAARDIGYPVIVKVAFGTHGKGVFYAENPETLSPIADYLAVRDGNPVVVEEFIGTGRPARDLRVFVLGGEVAAAMERVAREGEIRANAALGGVGRATTLSDDEAQTALSAAEAFGLEMAGVDLLRSARGPLVIEVNANPGFKELEKATGADIAARILEFAVRK